MCGLAETLACLVEFSLDQILDQILGDQKHYQIKPERNILILEREILEGEIRRHIFLLKTYLLHRCITLNLYHI